MGPRAVLAVLVTAQVLSVANQNLIAVALPSLSADLDASPVQQLWVVDVFVLVVAALLVAGGVLGDRYGRRRALVGGLALFAAGSLASALAADPGVLIAARVVQGLGPPLVLPASLALVTAAFSDPRARARAIGIWGAGSGLGVAVGPLLGGVLVSGLGWRWAFAVNVPVALVLIAGALVVIAPDERATARTRFDVAGAVLATAAMGALVFGLIEGPERGWSSPEVVAAFALAIVVAAAFVAVERRVAAPLVDLGVLRHRAFMVANLAALALIFVLLPVTVYVSAFLQAFRDLTALEAGLALLPLGLGVFVAAPVAGRLTARIAPRALIVVGLLSAAAGALLLSTADAGAEAGDLLGALALVGLGAGIALPPSTATAVAAVPLDQTGMASALHNAGRQIGGTLGVAVLGSIVVAHAHADGGGAGAYRDGLAAAMHVAAPVLVVAAVLVATTRVSRPRRRAPAA